MTLILKYKKIISIIIGLLIIPLIFTQLVQADSNPPICYGEVTDTTTNVTTLSLLPQCGSTTKDKNGNLLDSNGNALVDGACYYEEINSTGTVDEPESCTALKCQGGSTLSNGQNCSSIDPCDPTPSNPDAATSVNCSSIIQNYIDPLILFLGAGVGLVIVIMTVIGGIQYITSGGDPNHVAEAKKRITNAMLALITWILIWAFLEWIIPGGLF
jgi:hypothetical protein